MSNRGNVILQDIFLNTLRKDRVPATIYLVNGFQLRGTVKGFDNFTILLDNEGKQTMIYKHAISSINPIRPIELNTTTKDNK